MTSPTESTDPPESTEPRERPLVLVVEDDDAIGNGLLTALRTNGYRAERVATGGEALDTVEPLAPDAVLLDVGLPDLDGVHVCRTLRRTHLTLPIILLTARDAEIDIVVGLDAGATDYVTKPFSTHVLLARLRAHLRSAESISAESGSSESTDLVFGDLRVDVAGMRAFVSGVDVGLRPKEVVLLIRLASSPGRVLSRTQLLEDVWDMAWETSTNTLEVHMHALRNKLGPRADGRPWITTVRSLGYRFEA